MSAPLSPWLLEPLPEPERGRLAAVPDLEARLAAAMQAARRAWPEVDLAPEVFLPYLAERLVGRDDAEDVLADPVFPDLYLACALSRLDEAAIAAAEAAYVPALSRALVRRGISDATADEVIQTLRVRLFVGEAGAPPRIRSYSGRGRLKSWLTVSAIREGLRVARGPVREVEFAEELAGAAAQGDLAMAGLKHQFKDAFRSAVEETIAGLSPRERTLLKLQVIDGLSIDKIGAIYSVHRATAARWLEGARSSVRAGTRDRLRAALRVEGSELDSLMRLADSELEVSIERLLATRM